jgi:dTDP-4-dehydrorhamnose 3,5-epimerase
MNVIQTAILDVLIIDPKKFGDERGFFLETYQAERYADAGIPQTFVQDNLSRSVRGTLRGLHFQNPKAQGKLVTVVRGAVRDVAVDVGIGSPTFGKHVAVDLDDENRRQLWVPRGFAHGFVVLSESADFFTSAMRSTARRTKRSCVGTIRSLETTGASVRPFCRRAIAKQRHLRNWPNYCRSSRQLDTSIKAASKA